MCYTGSLGNILNSCWVLNGVLFVADIHHGVFRLEIFRLRSLTTLEGDII